VPESFLIAYAWWVLGVTLLPLRPDPASISDSNDVGTGEDQRVLLRNSWRPPAQGAIEVCPISLRSSAVPSICFFSYAQAVLPADSPGVDSSVSRWRW